MDTSDNKPLRLGFAVKVLGEEGLKSNDARRWQSEPHLRVSIGYLRDIFTYMAKHQMNMYRISSDVAPYVTHPDMPQFHGQIQECRNELKDLGDLARQHDIRLSLHPSQFIVLNSPDPVLVEKSKADLLAQAEILDCMGMGPEAVVIIHVGGTYGDHKSGCDRWVETFRTLPEPVRRRLVLENDDLRYSAADVLEIHERTKEVAKGVNGGNGVPLVFDVHHFWCNNPEGLDLRHTAEQFFNSWPAQVRPKMHYSSPNTNFREVQQRDKKTGKPKKALLPPLWTGHADFINPFEFATFARLMGDAFTADVMLESKAKDLALVRLRRDLPRYAPDVAVRFGLSPSPPDTPDDDIVEELEEATEGAD